MCSDFEKAEEIYKRLLSFKPEFIEPYYNYAMLLEKRMQSSEAIEYYKKALKYPEKYLSVITHNSINEAIERLQKHVVTLDRTQEYVEQQSEPQLLPDTDTNVEPDNQAEQIEQPHIGGGEQA